MINRCTIIAYHYVRDLSDTDYPEIKGLLTSEFEGQLDYLSKYYKNEVSKVVFSPQVKLSLKTKY